MMIGDGVNDTPALSEADVGVAINTGAAIAKEIADITVSSEDLFCLVALRRLASALMSRIDRNYRFIVGFNLMLILLGVSGVIQPTTSALFHNASTLGISLKSMTDLLAGRTSRFPKIRPDLQKLPVYPAAFAFWPSKSLPIKILKMIFRRTINRYFAE